VEQRSGDLALEPLDALVGEWALKAGPPGGEPWPGEGRVTFEWLSERTFLIERWVVPDAFDGIAIIGAGDEPDTLRRHYFDARGEHRIYEMTLRDGVWKQWRDAPDPFPQRFTGTFGDDGTTITSRWEKATDGSSWEADIDVTYRKVT
jgi:hypothetical protein